MVPFELSIAILNHIVDSRLVLLNNCGHWPPFEKPAEWTAQVLAFLQGYWVGRLAGATPDPFARFRRREVIRAVCKQDFAPYLLPSFPRIWMQLASP
jgi:hypothetical protein